MNQFSTDCTFERASARSRRALALLFVLLAACAALYTFGDSKNVHLAHSSLRHNARTQCAATRAAINIPVDFAQSRTVSDRYDATDAKPTIIRNATLWVGDGTVLREADLFLTQGVIAYVGQGIARRHFEQYGLQQHLVVSINALGAWVTPGLIDMHSHAGVMSIPNLSGSDDGNSFLGIVQPWLRSLDGLNTHDDAYRLAVAGGVSTGLALPGSADAIGGQAFVMKYRPTKERSPFSMLVDPPFQYKGSGIVPNRPPTWRHLKQACGENPSLWYGGTRMDSIYAMRSIYAEAKKLLDAQDAYCEHAASNDWNDSDDFPQDLRLELLVDMLRGRVKVHTHCYEAVDMDNLVRLSNEFRFPIAAFHHAHEAYLIPDVLKKAYGHPPALAIFSVFSRYKRESYRTSEFAPRILHDAGLEVVMKTDGPGGIDIRDLLFEAQQAHYYGLPENVALASVISTPAKVLGLDHRVGFLRRGYDADVVIWDSHPLQLGATPSQVFVDGIAQLDKPVVARKSLAQQRAPKTPDFKKETNTATTNDGLPLLEPTRSTSVRFINVKRVWGWHKRMRDESNVVVTRNGRIVCVGECPTTSADSEEIVVDLHGGEIAPGLTAYGGPYALGHIDFESSTVDGGITDALPPLLGEGALVKASDGLVFGTRNALVAYRSGVTRAVVAPAATSVIAGLSTAVSFGATYRSEAGAVPQAVVALHVQLARGGAHSVSTQIGILRNLLNGGGTGEIAEYFKRTVQGEIPLVAYADGVDIIATLLELKDDLGPDSKLRLVISGATEAHLLGRELAKAKVGVIARTRAEPDSWDMRRIAKRPPLEAGNNLSILRAHNVTVAFGLIEQQWSWRARNLRFDLAWAEAESDGAFSREEAVALATTNLEELLGLHVNDADRDMVAYDGGDIFSMESKVKAVIATSQGRVDLF